jgi:hypothetical protein
MTGYDSALDAVFRQSSSGSRRRRVLVHVALPKDETFIDAELQIFETEMKVGLDAYLGSHVVNGQPRSLAELIAWNDAHKDTVMPFFGQEYFVASQATTGRRGSGYTNARADTTRLTLTEGNPRRARQERSRRVRGADDRPAWVTDHAKGDTVGGSTSESPRSARPAPHRAHGTVNGLPSAFRSSRRPSRTRRCCGWLRGRATLALTQFRAHHCQRPDVMRSA